MTNKDLNTVNGSIQEAIERLEANLQSIGVYDAEFIEETGLLGLIELVNQIHPTLVSDMIDTSITLIPEEYSVLLNDTITFNGILRCSFNGIVDMTGLIDGASVKIYDGSTLVDTVTTNSNGEFTITIGLGSFGEHRIKAVFDGVNGEYYSSESSVVVVYCSNTILELDVPMSLVYTDNFELTGTLKDTNDTGIENKSIKLFIDGNLIDTDTTDSSGEFSFTSTAVSMGNYSFQVVFEGDNVYYTSMSPIISRDVDKETSVLNITSPVNNSNIYTDGTLTITGTLTTDDAESISDKSIIVEQDGTVLTTLTTGNDGGFTGSVSATDLTDGTVTIKYNGDSNYTECTSEYEITLINPSITLTSDKDILSYADSDTATLTATVTSAVPTGKTLQLYKMTDSTQNSSNDVLVGSMTDNNDGTYSCSYNSSSSGDVSLYVRYGSILSETYTVEDIWYYDDGTTDKGHWSKTQGNPDYSCGVNGLTLGNNENQATLTLDINYPSAFSIEFNVVSPTGRTNGYVPMIYANNTGITADNSCLFYLRESPYNYQNISNFDGWQQGDKVKFIVQNGQSSLYFRDTLRRTNTASDVKFKFQLSQLPITVTNIKIKEL